MTRVIGFHRIGKIGPRHHDDEPGMGMVETLGRLERNFRWRSWRIVSLFSSRYCIIIARVERVQS